MVHWLDDVMPLQSGGDQCAVLIRTDTTQWGGRCHRLPVVEARWRFEESVTMLRWCAEHADVLMRRDQFYMSGRCSSPVDAIPPTSRPSD